MAYKKLNQFTFFDYLKFSEGKVLKLVAIESWKDFDTRTVLGTKYKTVIAQDKTHYNCQTAETICRNL